jgi:hypothetical protein
MRGYKAKNKKKNKKKNKEPGECAYWLGLVATAT